MLPRRRARALPFVAVFSTLAAGARADDIQCLLDHPDANSATAGACLACHAGRGPDHPVDLDYAAASAAAPRRYRPAAEVIRRGVLLPDGMLRCVTCHDPRSPWASRIALPPGAPAIPAVNPRDPSTYEGEGRNWRIATAVEPPPRGTAVTASPLCGACHTLVD